jgi:hypothetical protein
MQVLSSAFAPHVGESMKRARIVQRRLEKMIDVVPEVEELIKLPPFHRPRCLLY